MENEIKKLTIFGIYPINNEINEKELKKRIPCESWTFSKEYFNYKEQLKLIKDISDNNYFYFDEISKLSIGEINRKISGYKQQDKLKNIYNKECFLSFESVITEMLKCQLKCRYCDVEMNLLYDISREKKQWTIDRINNDLGHILNNFHLACLECNLKRRRRTDEKYLFTKKLNIIKQDYKNTNVIIETEKDKL